MSISSALFGLSLSLTMAGCVTVRAQDRAVLADPIMQFEENDATAQRAHAIENREASAGGDGVAGGGCGCN